MCPTIGFELEEFLHQERKEQGKRAGRMGTPGARCPPSPGCGGGQLQKKHPILIFIRPEHLNITRSNVFSCSMGVPMKNNPLEAFGHCES